MLSHFIWETQPFVLKQKQGWNISVSYAKHSVIQPKTESGMELLSHFIIDTKSFVLKQKQGWGRGGNNSAT
jgi:hypothetical protein